MLLLTSDTSPPTSCLRPSFMRECKNVDWLQQAGSLYPPYHKIESRWRTQVHVVLEVSFFSIFSHDSYWNIFDLVFFFFLSAGMKGDVGSSCLVPWGGAAAGGRGGLGGGGSAGAEDSSLNIPDYTSFEGLSWREFKSFDTVTDWPEKRRGGGGGRGLLLEITHFPPELCSVSWCIITKSLWGDDSFCARWMTRIHPQRLVSLQLSRHICHALLWRPAILVSCSEFLDCNLFINLAIGTF